MSDEPQPEAEAVPEGPPADHLPPGAVEGRPLGDPDPADLARPAAGEEGGPDPQTAPTAAVGEEGEEQAGPAPEVTPPAE